MARTKEEQNLYNKLLVTQAINYRKRGYTDIKVNRSNYIHGHPSKVGGFTPDLSAVLEDVITLCEVVTDDSMNETQKVEKWRVLSRSGYNFHMITSQKCLNEVKEFTKNNGINVDKYWYSKNS